MEFLHILGELAIAPHARSSMKCRGSVAGKGNLDLAIDRVTGTKGVGNGAEHAMRRLVAKMVHQAHRTRLFATQVEAAEKMENTDFWH